MGFTFVDLFSGIGGFHIAATKNGGHCIQACDISLYAQKTYQLNFHIKPHDDIYTIAPVGNVDLVTFGSPCQPYSLAGMRRGLSDERGGKLFKQILKYLSASKAKCFIMENVPGMISSNQGKDLNFIKRSFEKLGYKLVLFTLNSRDFNIPQNRQRIYIVGHKTFVFDPSRIKTSKLLKHASDMLESGYPPQDLQKVQKKFVNVQMMNNPVASKSGIILKGKIGKGYTQDRVVSSHGVVGALIANWSPVIYDERYHLVRELSSRELLNFQGFPTTFKLPVGSRRDTIKAVGNAVCVPVVHEIIKQLVKQKLI